MIYNGDVTFHGEVYTNHGSGSVTESLLIVLMALAQTRKRKLEIKDE